MAFVGVWAGCRTSIPVRKAAEKIPMNKRSSQGLGLKNERRQHDAGRARAITTLGRQFDDLYEQFDLELTRMAYIQLQFDALRSKIRHL